MEFSLGGIRALWRGRAEARGNEIRGNSATGEEATGEEATGEEATGEEATGEEATGEEATREEVERGAAEPDDARHEPVQTGRSYAREAAALLLIASGLFLALALASYEADPLRPEVAGPDWIGPVGAAAARALVAAIGVCAWLAPLELMALSLPLLADKKLVVHLTRASGDVLVATILAALVRIALPRATSFGAMPVGGFVGDLFGSVMQGLFSTVGSFLIGLTVVALILVERAAFSFISAMQRLRAWIDAAQQGTARSASAIRSAWSRAREQDRLRRAQDARDEEPVIARPDQAEAIIAAFAEETESGDRFIVPTPDAPPAAANRNLPSSSDMRRTPGPAAVAAPMSDVLADAETPSAAAPAAPDRQQPRRPRKKPAEPVIVDTSAVTRTEKAKRERGKVEGSRFEPPPTDLLEAPEPTVGDAAQSEAALKETARLLEKTLADYKIEGRVQEIWPGPTVTMFEVSPAAGTKVSRVAALADDLALALSRKVRIVAPIPGKNRIGFEVPNERRAPVNLRELVESQPFVAMDAPLPCVLGRDIIGHPFFADLAAMPHVIVAGATGAGKSVALNVMLLSLLYRRTPEDMRLLMIDPKMVELVPFDRIPHLLLPVVRDVKQASNALKWAVDEMERRYQLFADAGTRNIVSYNKWVRAVLAGKRPVPAGPAKVDAIAPDGAVVEIDAAKDGSDEPPQKLPYIVIVIEEFCDLMMTQGKDVEASVARLAQKARAAGIHVILATQRPSVDVITGMIKANFPTRIAFRVTQRVDSRTILDEQGAEHLLGKGDMLVKLNGNNELKRVQCPFASEEEVQRVTDYLRAQGEPEYDESIVKERDDEAPAEDAGDAESDPMYDAAVRVVAETRKCSTSWIQRKLGIGYNRAAKMVETMERRGVVGPAIGTKPRDVLIAPV